MSLHHPPKVQLIAFGQGKLAAGESSEVEQHLEVCRECCETLLDLKDDTFVGLVKIAQSSDADRRMGTLARPAGGASDTESDKAETGKSAHPTDAETVLVQSGEPIGPDELPMGLADHPRYRVVELIGRGGMGNVYRAEHRLMNRAVAIKLINSQLMQHPHAVERFRREVQAAAKLSHPNIVAAYDAEQAGNAHFLVMEFVEGTDLASVVKHRGPMSVAEACECIRQAAMGLQHAHEKGMVHRDIKPHNLMLAAGGQVRILDFGLAGFAESALESSPVAPRQESRTSDGTDSRDQAPKDDPASTRDRQSCRGATGLLEATAAHLTTIGSVMGTPDYMAPEQAADAHSADIRADIYSLGCTLHFLLTGKPPFEADNVLMKLKAHAQEPPPSLTTLRKDVPIELANVVARMMAKNPAERFQTPAEVAAALALFAQPAETPPRKRTLRSVLAAAAAILLAGVIYITTDKGRIEIRTDVDDVDVVVSRGGEVVKTIDLATGSQVSWMQSGDYTISLKQNRNDIHIENSGFKLSRWGKEIVRVQRVTVPETAQPIVVAVKKGGHYFVDGRETNGALDLLNRLKFILEREPEREVVIESEKAHGMTVLNPLVELVREAGGKRLRLPDWVPLAEQAKLNLSGAGANAGGDPAATSKSASNSTSLTALRDLATVTAYLNDPRNNRGGSVPVALLGNNGRVAFRFGTWLVVFEGIVCDPKATILGFSNFNVPQPGSSGEGTVDFGTGDKLPGVLIKYKFANEQNEISINNNRFKLRGKATKLEFDDKAYDATNSVQTILVARDGSTRLQVAPAKADALVEVGRFKGHEGSASHAIFSPSGKYGISCGSDKTIRVWDIATQEEKRILKGHEGRVWGLAISTDGKLLASGDDAKSIRLWDLNSGEQVGELKGHTDGVSDLAFIPDRTHLLSAGSDQTLRLWHVADRKLVKTIDIGTFVEKMLTLTDDRRVMLSGAHTRGWGPIIYDLEKGEKIAETPGVDSCMAVSADGRLSLIGSITGVLVVRDTVTDKVLVQMTDPRVNVARDRGAFDAAITPDGRFAITTTREHFMYLWDLHGGKLLSTVEGETIGSITLSPDGRFALTIGFGGEISVWRLPESALEPIADLTDYDRLQGAWVCTEAVMGNKPLPKEALAATTMKFDHDHVEIAGLGSKTFQLRYALRQFREPKWIEFINPDKTADELSIAGLYELNGDALRVAFDDADRPRPRDFTPTDQRDHFVGTFRRASAGTSKPGSPEVPSQPARAVSSASQTAPASTNLLTDPSFENTPLTQLPNGWRAWLNDGQEFRCEVVAGGHTGQRCLKISGNGTRGVVFGNDLKADRTKRYALKGWAKFEGDKDARAIIKFNYFRGSEFLGVHDLVGATADQPGWHLLEKTDALDVYPQADHFYAMCHVEGSGTGWFDDLELVAYDRDKLPADFDLRHGRHNRLHGPNSLHRWVGTWDTEYTFRETDNSPQETKLSMTTTSERTLGDYFLMSHSKARPPASDERLQFLLFDQNLGAFRQWIFSSNGKVFEWRGPWNNEKQTLELRMLPDASNLHSSEHFVDDDHIEAKLKFQYVMGQRDAGRWTATRKAFDGKVDVPIAKTHVAQPAELSQLDKFAGEWTIRATYKPSVWNPLPREETIRETSVWILGGRFLMTRAFNEKDELTSIWIATYEPMEKSNRFWFFNADGSSGEWRLTWDEASRGFQFRAIDMPTGWSGTGFNRWVNEDSFDNQALIKDEKDRVLLDSTQDRRRKKSD